MRSAGLLAATLITACVLPQVVAVLRAKDVTGVSTTAAAQACVSCVAWTAYAATAGMGIAAVSSVIGAILWGVIAVVTGARTRSHPSVWVCAWVVAIVVLARFGGADVLGAVLLGEALTNTVPQALRTRERVEGVSAATYAMMAAGAACWVIYGIGAGDWALSASSLVKAAVCVYILALVVAGRRAAAVSSSIVASANPRTSPAGKVRPRARAASNASTPSRARVSAQAGRCHARDPLDEPGSTAACELGGLVHEGSTGNPVGSPLGRRASGPGAFSRTPDVTELHARPCRVTSAGTDLPNRDGPVDPGTDRPARTCRSGWVSPQRPGAER